MKGSSKFHFFVSYFFNHFFRYQNRGLLFFLLLSNVYLSVFSNYIHADAQTQSEKIIVDNFENGKHNSLGGNSGAFADNKDLGYCYLFYVQNKQKEIFGESKYSLCIQWDTSKEGAYGGYWTDLKHLNLEGFNYLTFYVKGSKGGEKFKIGLRDKLNSNYETKILINEVLIKGVTTEWQRVIITLKRFEAIQDWRDVNIFSINFEYAFGSEKGLILVDEIAFEK
ncbi:MAG: hypothetical protein ABIB41_02220 [Nitrospirota bacterium]